MRRLLLFLALVLLGLAHADKPNIVYILADDLGYGDPRCYNPEGKIPTPNIDRLAAEGARFTDMHSGSAVCTPTRYGILTGRYSWRSRLQKGVLEGLGEPLIPPTRTTVASFLKAQGYATAAVGKWHLGLDWTYVDHKTDYAAAFKDGPNALGFDYYFGIPASLDMPPYVYVENDHVVEAATNMVEKSEAPKMWRGGPIAPSFKHQEVLPTLTQKACDLIAKHPADKPIFLYLALTAPHTPVLPSEASSGKSDTGLYGDFVVDVDNTVGAVTAALAQAGIADNTLVIFTSDNGFAPPGGRKEVEAHHHNPEPGLRGNKADIFEGGHRIPFIARWPKHVPAGTVRTDTAWLGDFFATATSAAGATPPKDAAEDSVSLLPALLGKEVPPRGPVVHHSGDGYFAIRDGQWKLIFCAHSGGWSEPKPNDPGNKDRPQRQLYDLAADLAEQHNVATDHPEVVARLTQELQTIIDQGRSTPGDPLKNDVPIDWQRP